MSTDGAGGRVQAFWLVYATSLYEYRNIQQTSYSLMRVLLGDFDVNAL